MKFAVGTHVGAHTDTGWKLRTGTGVRTTDYFVPYGKEFRRMPKVHAALAGFDVEKTTDSYKLSIGVVDIQDTGFVLRYKTWSKTSVLWVNVSWMAVSEKRIRGRHSQIIENN